MKNILKLSLLTAVAVVLGSCETYEVEDPKTTAVAPMDGRWICWAYAPADYAANGENAEKLNYIEMHIAATTTNSKTEMWVNYCDFLVATPYVDCTSVKADCSVKNLAFSAAERDNVLSQRTIYNYLLMQEYYTVEGNEGARIPYKVTITDGKVVRKGYNTPSGSKADAISLTYKRVGEDGNVEEYVLVGHRYTGWGEDYEEFNAFIEAASSEE